MDPLSKTIHKVVATICRHRMIDRGDRVVVAVSGGADSVCLLDVLYRLRERLGITLTVAHFDHGLRPAADGHETQFVRDFAASLHLEVVVSNADPPLDPTSASLEEKARVARYRFLLECQEACGAQRVATGHTLNDQAETVLIRLLRGSGPAGLSGIRPVRGDGIIRPLIQVSRGEIDAYLLEMGLSHVTDASNMESCHLRNDIRLKLIPHLQSYQPRIADILARTADITREENQWLEAQAHAWIQEWGRGGSQETVLSVCRYRELPEAMKNHVVRAALKTVAGSLTRITRGHVEAIRRLTESKRPQAMAMLPGGIHVKRVYDTLNFSKAIPQRPEVYCCFIERPGAFDLDAMGCTVILEEVAPEGISEKPGGSPWTAFFDADCLVFPLMLRNYRHGDRLVPLGMTGRKKLKDLFVDMKIPSHIRSRIPVLAQRDQVIWVCGLRMDDRFKVTPHTRRVLKITLEGAAPMRPV